MKKIILFLVFWGSALVGLSQKSIKYNYVVYDNLNGEKNKPYFAMQYEFSTIRKYEKKNIFNESRLFTGSNKQSVKFKRVGSVWYYYSNRAWNLFCDFEKGCGGNIMLGKEVFKVQCHKRFIFRGRNIYIVSLKPEHETSSHNQVYFFDTACGAVAILTSSGSLLLRADYYNKPLTDREVEVFNY